jgi:hypothetical protein
LIIRVLLSVASLGSFSFCYDLRVITVRFVRGLCSLYTLAPNPRYRFFNRLSLPTRTLLIITEMPLLNFWNEDLDSLNSDYSDNMAQYMQDSFDTFAPTMLVTNMEHGGYDAKTFQHHGYEYRMS